MSLLFHVARILSVAFVVLGINTSYGQTYPTKPVRIITGAAGGGSDLAARLIADGISGPLGQQVIVDNRASAAGPGPVAYKATPDGYTLLLDGSSFWIGTLLQETPYDPVKDFLPISLTASAPNVLAIHPSVPASSVKELIALANAKPGVLNYSIGSPGGSPHLAAELFRTMANINIVRIPYKGGAQATIAVVAGEVQMTFSTGGSVKPHLQSGKLKGLAVTSAQPSPLFPGLPTLSASGLPGYEASQTQAIFALANTPSVIVARLNREVVLVLRRPDVKEKLFNAGIDALGSSPQELASTVKTDLTKWGKVIKEAGIRAD